jgi:ATP-dependent RNA helicase RhlE
VSFQDLAVHPRLLHVLDKQGISDPTPVQEKAIPEALEGRDVVAIAQTGTGKTLAFGLPVLTRLGERTKGRNMVLVLTPTRELARQIDSVMFPLAKALGHRAVSIFGGVGMEPQIRALRRGVSIVVATPGRLLDHINRGTIDFRDLKALVLDEADRMLDMGFMPDIKRIMNVLPEDRQTLLFSATFPKEIESLAAGFQRNPVSIRVAAQSTPAESVRQSIFTVCPTRKLELLQTVLQKPEVGPALVFLRTKYRTEKIAKSLSRGGLQAQAIHGGRSQRQRDQAIDGFRSGRYDVLVATDVAARGLDIKGVTHVVNFDIPNNTEDYIHRIGRTARAQAEGDAITFVSPEDAEMLHDIERTLGRALHRHEWEGTIHVPMFDPEARRGRSGQGGGKRSRGPRSGGRFNANRPKAAKGQGGQRGGKEDSRSSQGSQQRRNRPARSRRTGGGRSRTAE